MTIRPPEPMIEPTLGERLVVDRHVEVLGRDAAARRAAGLDRLERPAVGDAAADVEDDLAQRDAHRAPRSSPVLTHLAGEREDLGALALRACRCAANQSPPLRMIGATLAKVSTLLMSVGLVPQPGLGRVRRPRARRAATALDRGDQRRLFAAHEGAGAEPDLDVEARTRCRAIVGAEVAGPVAPAGWPSRSRLTASGYSPRQ